MLRLVQHARFVAIDVEMTGIYMNQTRSNSRTSIQDAYTKIRESAEEFQILQIGLTFFHYDESAEYKTLTFSYQISPLFPKGQFADGLTRFLDRKFSISAKSYGFLRGYGLNLSNVLDNGVYYMNRDEQRRVEKFCSYEDTDDGHIDPLSLDEPSQQFYRRIRANLLAYVSQNNPKNLPTIIRNPYGDKLNGLQARLIHQIIREEYPMCTAKRVSMAPLGSSMSVRTKSQAMNIEDTSQQQARAEEAKKLTGLQILFEALCGGSFASRVNREWVYNKKLQDGADPFNDINKTFDFHQCEASLKQNGPVIIGHNLFYDLVFIYRTFYEPLPPSLDDFLDRIHELFPRIVDTKYMRVRGQHMMQPASTLQELRDVYAHQQVPTIRSEPGFGYRDDRPHHAGYDSLITAQLFLKQTHDYFTRRMHQTEASEQIHVRPCRDKPGTPTPDTPNANPPVEKKKISNGKNSSDSILDEDELETIEALRTWSTLDADLSYSRRISGEPATPSKAGENRARTPTPTAVRGETRSTDEPIPPWTDDFWRIYGNKTSFTGIGTISFV
ncbi:CAF1-domain-containing protein [Xylariaceae sp. FL0662B]|nr:CAF1-domain-containing protein [Xylariaceae sp. FL0662B]